MKKSLSILLALLMILCSMPIMSIGAAAEETTTNPNVMANYTVANGNFGVEYYGSVQDTDVSLGGGNGVYVKDCMSQTFFTKVTLKTNTKYNFSFNWKAEENEKGGVYPSAVKVYSAKAGDPFDASLWDNSVWPQYRGDTTTYPNLRTSATAVSQDDANTYSWKANTITFNTTTDTEYLIMIDLSTTNANHQNIYFSDFKLIDPNDSVLIPLDEKTASDWYIPANATITDDNSITQDGITSKYRWTNSVWQKLSTAVTLKPNTQYTIAFDYYVQKHEQDGATPRIEHIEVFSAENGSVLNSSSWNGETYANFPSLLVNSTDFVHTTSDTSKANVWQKAEFTFTTTEATTYNIILYGNGSKHLGKSGGQNIYFANMRAVTAVEKPGNLLDDASNYNGQVTWSTSNDSNKQEANIDARRYFKEGKDNPEFSVNGGYAWAFGFGDSNSAGDNYSYIYVKANGLKAGKTYDFSYIYDGVGGGGFILDLYKIENANGQTVSYTTQPATTNVSGNSYKVSTLFTVPADGDYTIYIRGNRDKRNGWNTTILCDLELYERGTMYDFAVAVEGNGSANADKTGLVEEGTVVSLSARPELYETFNGWYVGDQLVSSDANYAYTVTGNATVVAKFTAKRENLMGNYTTSNFVARYYGSIQDGASRYGGLSFTAAKVPHQNLVTKVTLEANKEYTLSFEYKPIENISNKEFVHSISVKKILTPEIDILASNRDDAWVDGKGYSGQLGADIELTPDGSYGDQATANTCTWQNVTTSFTPTESGEYAILIGFRHESLTNEELAAIKAANPSATNLATTGNNNQSVGFSDFVLKEVLVPTGTKYTWDGARYAKVTDSTDSKDGGYAYDVDRAMQQNISTDLALKPATNYSLTFNWKSVANENGLAYVQSASVYSALSGDRTPDNKTNYKWTDTDYVPVYVPNEGYFDLLTDVDNPNGGKDTAADNATLTAWNTYSATFTTSEEADYYLFINFGFKGTKYDDQNVIISDVVIEEIVTGAAPAGDDMIGHGGLSLRKEEEEGGQAIRYKFGVDKDVINAAQTDGYELVEYGAVVAVAEELNAYANDPVLDATKYTVRKGVAYDKANGTSVVFDETDEEVIYTIALYNIPTYNYDTQIAVRPYAVFKNSAGDSYVRYGTTRYGCVFEVAQSIIANPEKQDDLDYVNNTLLAGDVKAAYDAWAAN